MGDTLLYKEGWVDVKIPEPPAMQGTQEFLKRTYRWSR